MLKIDICSCGMKYVENDGIFCCGRCKKVEFPFSGCFERTKEKYIKERKIIEAYIQKHSAGFSIIEQRRINNQDLTTSESRIYELVSEFQRRKNEVQTYFNGWTSKNYNNAFYDYFQITKDLLEIIRTDEEY